ncbi:hypothetical protein ACJJTC_019298 [Scirpophaga incertulas]
MRVLSAAKRSGRFDLGILDLGSAGETVRLAGTVRFLRRHATGQAPVELHVVQCEVGGGSAPPVGGSAPCASCGGHATGQAPRGAARGAMRGGVGGLPPGGVGRHRALPCGGTPTGQAPVELHVVQCEVGGGVCPPVGGVGTVRFLRRHATRPGARGAARGAMRGGWGGLPPGGWVGTVRFPAAARHRPGARGAARGAMRGGWGVCPPVGGSAPCASCGGTPPARRPWSCTWCNARWVGGLPPGGWVGAVRFLRRHATGPGARGAARGAMRGGWGGLPPGGWVGAVRFLRRHATGQAPVELHVVQCEVGGGSAPGGWGRRRALPAAARPPARAPVELHVVQCEVGGGSAPRWAGRHRALPAAARHRPGARGAARGAMRGGWGVCPPVGGPAPCASCGGTPPARRPWSCTWCNARWVGGLPPGGWVGAVRFLRRHATGQAPVELHVVQCEVGGGSAPRWAGRHRALPAAARHRPGARGAARGAMRGGWGVCPPVSGPAPCASCGGTPPARRPWSCTWCNARWVGGLPPGGRAGTVRFLRRHATGQAPVELHVVQCEVGGGSAPRWVGRRRALPAAARHRPGARGAARGAMRGGWGVCPPVGGPAPCASCGGTPPARRPWSCTWCNARWVGGLPPGGRVGTVRFLRRHATDQAPVELHVVQCEAPVELHVVQCEVGGGSAPRWAGRHRALPAAARHRPGARGAARGAMRGGWGVCPPVGGSAPCAFCGGTPPARRPWSCTWCTASAAWSGWRRWRSCRQRGGARDGFYLSLQPRNSKHTAVLALAQPSLRQEKLSRRDLMMHVYRPNTGLQLRLESLADLEKKYRRVESEEAESAWRAQHASSRRLCSHAYWRGACRTPGCEVGLRRRQYHVLAGSVLAVWARVEAVLAARTAAHKLQAVLAARTAAHKLQVVRVRLSTGRRVVGVCLCVRVCACRPCWPRAPPRTSCRWCACG